MSSADIFYALGHFLYWMFEHTLEPLADLPWRIVLLFGFAAFGYWMWRQRSYNKAARENADQIK